MALVLFRTRTLSTLRFDNSLKLLLAREWNARCWEHVAAEIAHCDRDALSGCVLNDTPCACKIQLCFGNTKCILPVVARLYDYVGHINLIHYQK